MAGSSPPSRSPSAGRRARRVRSRSPLQHKSTTSPTRSPLQEKSSSETNVSRTGKDKKPELNVFSTTPFPTKPQHILLPSTIRKQKSFHNTENELPVIFAASQPDGSRQPGASRQLSGDATRRAPVLHLKKSVTTLRDLYEAHERSSRPSTATTSPALRPMSSSTRLRSASSSEGLAGRSTWGVMHKISSDDMALLPSLNEVTIRKMESQSSFASKMTRLPPVTSSPNHRILGFTSPKIPVFRDEPILSSDTIEPSSSTGARETLSSTPNFVRLGRSSSLSEVETMPQPFSSPNFVKLGTSSPVLRDRSSPTPSFTSSIRSLKRKREIDDDQSSLAVHDSNFNSSPPFVIHAMSPEEPRSPDSFPFNSSPPDAVNVRSQSQATPVFHIPVRSSSESFASSSHASLQAALSSSPMPPIQYPIVRAPASSGQSLTIPKRISRGAQVEGLPSSSSRLSPVPSEWEERLPSSSSMDSHAESTDSGSVQVRETGNESQIRIISDDHSQEESDELSALPRPSFRSPPLVPVRTNSLYGTLTSSSASNSLSRLNSLRHSMDSRLNSIRSYSHSRQNSIIANSLRPSSSGSVNANVMVPTWARRYYAGFYHDSFQYLYNPSQNGSAAQLSVPPPALRLQRSQSLKASFHDSNTNLPEVNRSSLQSFRNSLRQSLTERLPSLFRPRPQARDSHLMIGVGPLVSNPTQPDVAVLSPDPDAITPTIRRVSGDQILPPIDPRAHWAGMAEAGELTTGPPTQRIPRHSVDIQPAGRPSAESDNVFYSASVGSGGMASRFRFLPSPHLHRDQRLNTGSSASRGYGHPFNNKPQYHAARTLDDRPDGYGRPSWFSLDLRSTQVFLFVAGFVCPVLWFVASVLPLPHRPTTHADLEKAEWDAATVHGTRPISEWEELDVVARLRMERHLKGLEEIKWQNARWWRRMNRFMSIVGIVVIVVVIVLAVISTRGGI